MSQKAIREYQAKKILARWFNSHAPHYNISDRLLQILPSTNIEDVENQQHWILDEKLVAKPDQLIKRRGKAGLLKINSTWNDAKKWILERRNKEITVEHAKGILDTFLVEPFVPHHDKEEFYICIQSVRQGQLIMFHHEGGVDVGDVDEKAVKLVVPIDQFLTNEQSSVLVQKAPAESRDALASFLVDLFTFYTELNFAYLEINPLVVKEGKVFPLDMAAKVDETAEFESGDQWGKIDFPAPFGRAQTEAEKYIASLDAKTGASLKLTVLNPNGRVWTMVAGGGASVIYADAISDLGYGTELANYGEYSGDPSEGLTYEYACTILGLMTKSKPDTSDNSAKKLKIDQNKILIIGGGIANFTNVAETFKGIVRALEKYQKQIIEQKIQIFVRRGGPNYQNGLQMMLDCAARTGISIQVFGPETHLTSVVPHALGVKQIVSEKSEASNPLFNIQPSMPKSTSMDLSHVEEDDKTHSEKEWYHLFTKHSIAIVFGMQPKAVQNMLDFDHCCGRKKPSVCALIYPFSANHFLKFYWGTTEMMIPVYQHMQEAIQKHPEATIMVNFASMRSVFSSVTETLLYPQIKTIAIIAEGVPENRTKSLLRRAKEKGVTLIGPATVGGIKPGCFRIGNTGGMIDNIIASKLYRPGSVAYVSRSGGMSNELNNIISRNSNGVYEGIAIGGDRFPGSTFMDHLLRFETDPEAKILVLLGEVGGTDEYDICDAIKAKKITKPLIAWCMGTCAKIFPYEIQFGHAGASARGQLETAEAKNKALKAAGAFVPDTFDAFGEMIKSVFTALVTKGIIVPKPEPPTPVIPMDYSWAQKLGLIRKPTSFVSTISDERGDELTYSGIPISKVMEDDIGVGGVLSLLWFKRKLPSYATKYIEMVLMTVADHGPAVSGAHNTIVTARAGKDLVSSLTSGLMTIGPRFGGAVDDAAVQFAGAFDKDITPKFFVEDMKKNNKLIMGIGHRIKSVQNPDKRVVILAEFALKNFPNNDVLKYAFEVEKVTTSKNPSLILNVDGCIGCSFVDMLRGCGAFTKEEADAHIKIGFLNGLFVLGRSIGLIGHYLDQVRLKQPLYRHPWDDISYLDDSL